MHARAALVLLALVAALLCTGRAASALPPNAPALYVTPDYDDYGAPVLAHAHADTNAYPRLYVWPNGKWNLVGVRYGFWSPPASRSGGPWAPRSHRRVQVNYWGWLTGPTPEDLMTYSGFANPGMTLFDGVPGDSVIRLKSGTAEVTFASDSVIELRTTILMGNPLWSADHAETSYTRLVPEGWARAGN